MWVRWCSGQHALRLNQNIFLVLNGKSQECACAVAGDLTNIAKNDVSKNLYVTSGVKQKTFSGVLSQEKKIIYILNI